MPPEHQVGSSNLSGRTIIGMPFVYVLRSKSTGRFYTGATTNLDARLAQHKRGLSISTKNRGPWVLVHQEQFPTMGEALLQRTLSEDRQRTRRDSADSLIIR